MTDNYVTNAGSGGSTFAADDIGGILYARIKLSWGADGSAVDASLANPLPVSTSIESSQMTIAGVAVTPKYAAISASSSGNNTLISSVSGKKIRVLAVWLVSNGTVNAKFQSGAGGTDLTGLAYLIANTGFALSFNPAGWFETASTTLLNLNLSAAIAVGGSITYIEV